MSTARRSLAWLLPLVAAPFFLGLGSLDGGSHPDEATYFTIGLETDESGGWWTPVVEGRPVWVKPPLLYWAEGAAYAALGRSVFAARLPVALAAVALVLLTGALARRMYGAERAILASLVAASCFGILRFGRLAMMDVPLALAMTWAAYGVYRAVAESRPGLLLHVGAAAGASAWLKGPIGVLVIALFSGAFIALRSPRMIRSAWFPASVVLGAAVGLPWFVASYVVHGRAFIDAFLVIENVGKFRAAWQPSEAVMLPLALCAFALPWTPSFLGGLALWRKGDPRWLLLALWIGALLGVFLLPSIKYVHYVLPAVPAAVLLAIHPEVPDLFRRATRWFLVAAGVAALVAAAAAMRLAVAWPAVAMCAVASAFILGAAAAFGRSERWGAALACLSGALFFGGAIPSALSTSLPAPVVSSSRALYTFNLSAAPVWLSAGRTAKRQWGAPEEACQVALDGGLMVLPMADYARCSPETKEELTEIARWRRWRSRISVAQVWEAVVKGDRGDLQDEVIAITAARASSSPPIHSNATTSDH